MTGDARPFFCFFSFLGLVPWRATFVESFSRTFCLLGMQPILFKFVSGTEKQAAYSVRTHEERLGGGVRKRRDGERAGRADI